MINWAVVAPAIRELLSGLAVAIDASPEFEGRWADRKAGFIHPEVQKELILRVTRVSDVAANRRYDAEQLNDGSTALREHVVGLKEFVLEVRVESYDHSEEDERWAWSMADRIRTSLRLRRSIDAMLAVNVGIADVGVATDVSFTFDRHRVNAASFDVTMTAGFDFADPLPTSWFERVELTSKIKNPAGVILPSPPNVTALVVPPLPAEGDD